MKYDYLLCEQKAKDLGITLEDIFSELDEYAEEFVLCWLANRYGLDVEPNIVEGTYTSVWDGEGEITAKARINLNTRKVEILESFEPSDCYTEDGEPFECEFLIDEYITIDGVNYPCCEEVEADGTGFYYE